MKGAALGYHDNPVNKFVQPGCSFLGAPEGICVLYGIVLDPPNAPSKHEFLWFYHLFDSWSLAFSCLTLEKAF